MARRASGIARAVALSATFLSVPLAAQTLTLLNVRSFDLSADRTSVAVGEVFHLTLAAHVDERVQALDNVQLPSLAGFEDLGDERRCTRAKCGAGSDCVETLTLAATEPGDRLVGPGSVDYLDAGSGRLATRQSNDVLVHVSGNATPASTGSASDVVWPFARALGIFACVVIAAYALVWGFGRRPRRPLVAAGPPEPPEAPPPAPDWSARMRELGAFLADEPSRARAVAVRAELRSHLRAGERETLGDLRRRGAAAADDAVMRALAAVERAAFCEDAAVGDAAREAVPFLVH